GSLAWRMFIDLGGFEKDETVKDRLGRPRRTRTFPNANRSWQEAMERGGFRPTRSYDLVHSYCTRLLHVGGDISPVSKARGHRDIRTPLIYTQVNVDPRLAAAVRRTFDKKPATN